MKHRDRSAAGASIPPLCLPSSPGNPLLEAQRVSSHLPVLLGHRVTTQPRPPPPRRPRPEPWRECDCELARQGLPLSSESPPAPEARTPGTPPGRGYWARTSPYQGRPQAVGRRGANPLPPLAHMAAADRTRVRRGRGSPKAGGVGALRLGEEEARPARPQRGKPERAPTRREGRRRGGGPPAGPRRGRAVSTCEQKYEPWMPSLMQVGHWSLASLLQPSVSHTRVSTAAMLPGSRDALPRRRRRERGTVGWREGRGGEGGRARGGAPAPGLSAVAEGAQGRPGRAARPAPHAQLAPRPRPRAPPPGGRRARGAVG